MKRVKKGIIVLLGLFVLITLTAVPARASTVGTRKKGISSVSLKIEAKIPVDMPVGSEQIDIKTGNGRYYLDGYEVSNSIFRWSPEDTPELQVTLLADEGYYFNIQKSSDIHITGGTYLRSMRENSSSTLVVTVRLPSLDRQVGEVTGVAAEESGRVTWNPAESAGSYEVKVFRGNASVGTAIRANDTEINMGTSMTRAGTYQVRVRALNRVDPSITSQWSASASVVIPEELARANQRRKEEEESAGAWIKDQTGYRFITAGGDLMANAWRYINSEWYYFKEDGYMATGWFLVNGKWYYLDPENGNMWKNTTTPDGYPLSIDGSWITN